MHFQVLTGIQLTLRPRLYGPISFSITLLIAEIAFITTKIKKMKEQYKEWKLHQSIIINLNEQQKFNNVKNNFPLLSGFQTALLVGFVLAGNITFWFLEFSFNDSKHFYKQFLLKQCILLFIYNIVIPIIYLIKKKKMRKYFWKYVSDVLF